MKIPVELNSLLKFLKFLPPALKLQTIMDVMYNSNCLKSLLLTI